MRSLESLMRYAVVVTLLSIVGLVPSFAAETGVGLRAGTQGFGAEFGYALNERVGLRGGIYGASVNESFDEAGIRYDGDLQLGGVGVLADIFVFKGSFRLSAGLFANDNEIELVASPTQPQDIGGTVYTPAEIGQILGEVTFDDTVPYFGIGWGNVARGKRFGFLVDLGVLVQGSGDVRLRSTQTAVSQADLDAEAREIERDISEYDLWPVISFGLAIRF